FEGEAGGVRERREARAVGESRGVFAAEDNGAEGEVDFVHETGLKERAIDFTAAFAEEAADVPLLTQPAEGEVEVQFAVAADFNLVGQRAEAFELRGACAVGGEDDDGREAVFEDFGARVEGAGSADDDAEVVFGEAAPQTGAAIFCAAGAQFHRREIDGARAGHDSVGGGAKFEQVRLVARAGERNEMAGRRGEFAVGGHGGVQINEYKAAFVGSWSPGHFKSRHCVETRTKPCLDGLNTESGMDTTFVVPSPGTMEYVLQVLAVKLVLYCTTWLKPLSDTN